MRRFHWLCSGAVGAMFLPVGAFAQTAPAPQNTVGTQDTQATQNSTATTPAPATDQRDVADIIVTAQRRSESLVNVPVAVTVLSSETLGKQAISNERDLQIAVPGLTVRAAFNSDQLNYAIRGQTIDPFTNSQPGVLPYVNEYQIPTGFTSTPLFDLDSVQVLKGPQGTLFGRNAIGGAVLFTTVQPSFKFGGYAKARAGDYGLLEFEGAVNVPISDTLAVRIAGRTADAGGYFKNITTGNRLGSRQTDTIRGSILFKPSDSFSNTLVVDYTNTRGTTTPARLYSQYPLGATNNGVALSGTATALFSPALDSVFMAPGLFSAYINANGLTNTNAAGGLNAFFNATRNQDPNSDVRLNSDPVLRGKVFDAINTTTLSLGANTQLKSIIGYTNSRSFQSVDADGTPYIIESPDSTLEIDQFSAELQLSGKTFDNKLQYVLGAYYFNSDTLSNQFATVFSFAPVVPPLQQFNLRARAKGAAIAGYAQGTYDLGAILPGLEFTGGIRYTSETQRLQQEPGGLFFTTFGAAPQRVKIGRVNYQAGVQYHITRRAMLYGKVGSSFRSGGFNLGSAPLPGTAAAGGNGFTPETTTSYELGAKFEGRLVNLPFRANIAAFSQTVSNVQRAVYFVPPGGSLAGFTANIPEARVQGIEVDGYISPAKWLQVGANASFIDAKFTKPTTVFFGQSKTFGPYPDTPKFSGSVYAQVDIPVGNDFGNVSLRGDLYHQSTSYFGSLNNTTVPGTNIAPYTVANFRLGIDKIAGTGVSVAGYLKNAFNEKYYVGGIPLGEVLSLNTAVPGAPRTYFIEASIKF